MIGPPILPGGGEPPEDWIAINAPNKALAGDVAVNVYDPGVAATVKLSNRTLPLALLPFILVLKPEPGAQVSFAPVNPIHIKASLAKLVVNGP